MNLYLRQKGAGIAIANDTSCGVGYAPLNELERVELRVETYLNASDIKSVHPGIGEYIKVMGVRRDDSIELTVACAFIDQHIVDLQLVMHDGISIDAVKSRIEEIVLDKLTNSIQIQKKLIAGLIRIY